MRSCLGLGWRTCGSNGRLSGPGCLFRPRQAVPIGLQSLRRRIKAACSADLRQGQQQEGQLAARAGSPSGSSAEGDGGSRAAAAAAALGLVALPTLLGADPALAAQIHMEPENALSLPTWAGEPLASPTLGRGNRKGLTPRLGLGSGQQMFGPQ